MRSLLDVVGRPLAAWLRGVIRFPRFTLVVCTALTVASAVIAITQLEFVSGLNSVLGGTHRFNQVYEDYLREFGQNAPLVVVIDDGFSVESQALARELADELSRSGQFQAAWPVLPPPNPWSVSTRQTLPVVREALWRLEPARDVMALPSPPVGELDALRQIAVPDETERARMAELENLLSAVPPDKRLPSLLLWSDFIDRLTRDVESADSRRIRRAGAYVHLLEDARRTAGFVRPRGSNPASEQAVADGWSGVTIADLRSDPKAWDLLTGNGATVGPDGRELRGLDAAVALYHRDRTIGADTNQPVSVGAADDSARAITLLPPGTAWNVARFWAWAGDQPALATTRDRVALVIVSLWPESTEVRSDLIRTNGETASRPGPDQALESFHEIVSRVRMRYPRVVAGVTGRPLLNNQEKQAQNRSSTTAGLLSFGLVFLVVVIFVRRMRLCLSIIIALACALVWTMGALTLTVGELNVLSSAFAVILCATGIDFGIHLGSAYDHRRALGWSREDAIEGGLAVVGRGVVAGALTTAAAFAATMVADFQAVVQLGQIAAMGMLICAFAMFTVLPAMLVVLEPRESLRQRVPDPVTVSATRLSSQSAAMGLFIVALTATMGLIVGLDVRFNPSRVDLLDPAMAAMPWIRQLESRSDRSSRFGVVVCDSEEEARRRVDQFRTRKDLVKDAEYLLDHLPDQAAERRDALVAFAADSPTVVRRRESVFRPDLRLRELRRPAIRLRDAEGQPMANEDEHVIIGDDGNPVPRLRHEARVAQLSRLLLELERAVDADRLRGSLNRMLAAISFAEVRMATAEAGSDGTDGGSDGTGPAQTRPGLPELAAQRIKEQTREALADLQWLASSWLEWLRVGPFPDANRVDQIAWQKTANLGAPIWQTLLRGELAMLEGMSERFPTTRDEIDPTVRRQFVSPAGKWLVQVYAKKDVWEEDAREEFVAFGERIDPDFTGGPAQYQRGLEVLRAGFLKAGLLALVAVFVLLVIDFLPPLMAMIPVVVLAGTVVVLTTFIGMAPFTALLPALAFTCIACGRMVYEAMLAMVPLAVAACLTLGTMHLAGVSFNPANIIILPALLGVGIDIGIHLVHSARRGDGHVRVIVPEGSRALVNRLRAAIGIGEASRRHVPLFTPTAAAVIITSVTTIFGFGSLMIAGHVGLKTLGWLFAVAIFWCMLAAFVALPALTRLYPLRRRSEDPGYDEPATPHAPSTPTLPYE